MNVLGKWVGIAGWLLVIVGVVTLSPLLDLLPVEVWAWLSKPFQVEHGPASYYRVVPAEGNGAAILKITLVVLGSGLIVLGRHLRGAHRRLP